MTEEEWLAATDPTAMLRSLAGKTSERKVRLLLCGCCRRLWHLFREPSLRNAIEISEQYADAGDFNDQIEPYQTASTLLYGEIDPRMGRGVVFDDGYGRQLLIQAALGPLTDPGGVMLSVPGASDVLALAAEAIGCAASEDHPRLVGRWAEERRRKAESCERTSQCDLIRDIFGNPFRSASVGPSWLTSTVVALAEGIYQERAFDRMPILADALEEAGCDHEDILNHCRGDGPHVRGCWVLDLLIGRK